MFRSTLGALIAAAIAGCFVAALAVVLIIDGNESRLLYLVFHGMFGLLSPRAIVATSASRDLVLSQLGPLLVLLTMSLAVGGAMGFNLRELTVSAVLFGFLLGVGWSTCREEP